MKVKKLIEELSELDPEKEVWFSVSEDVLSMGGEYSSMYATSTIGATNATIYEYGDELYEDEDILKDEIRDNYDGGEVDTTIKAKELKILDEYVEEVFQEVEKKKREVVVIDVDV